ncbi:MAG: dockerin type I repeat-containing protein [Lachnospiraceae bacterium]|nr:dockerin type I repeat-containing protein [Lachnospiraceae bacterium]
MSKPINSIIAFGAAAAILSSAVISADAYVLGDINGDNSIDLRDSYTVQRAALGLVTLDAEEQTAADMDGDGAVTLKDAYILMRLNLGLKDVVDKYAYNKAERIALINMINEDRESRGVAPLEYHDASLAAGQIRAEEVLSGYLDLRPDERSIDTLFPDNNMSVNNPPFDYNIRNYAYNTAKKYYEYIQKYDERVYNDYFMNPNYSLICLGTVEGGRRSYYMTITMT